VEAAGQAQPRAKHGQFGQAHHSGLKRFGHLCNHDKAFASGGIPPLLTRPHSVEEEEE